MMHIFLCLTIVVLDQFTKRYMVGLLAVCERGNCQTIEVLPIFKLMVLYNTGAAFSFLSDAGGWQRWFLVCVSAGVSVFIAIWLYRIRLQEKRLALGLSFILGGAIGNLIDRVATGSVVDFIVVHWQSHYFPAFNIADSAIFIGACLLALDMFTNADKKEMENTNGQTKE